MKQYLNQKEKQIVIKIAALQTFLEERIEEWEELDRPQKLITNAKYARTYAKKTLEKMLENIETEHINQVYKEAQKKEVIVDYTRKAKRRRKRREKLEEVTPVVTEDFYDIVELALWECINCEKEQKAIDECKQRKLFLKYNVPVLNEKCPEGECPYQYKG